jgi:hypothetical protein
MLLQQQRAFDAAAGLQQLLRLAVNDFPIIIRAEDLRPWIGEQLAFGHFPGV